MNKTRFFVSILALITFYGCADNKTFEADLCPDDPDKTMPGLCGCGKSDVDTDGDGTPDCTDGCPEDKGKAAPGMCGCGIPEVDENKDGLMDCIDLCKDDPDKKLPGECGCGVPDVDSDGNGIMDCFESGVDLCPDNPDKTKPEGICGCDSEIDRDGDTTPDCIDQCPDDENKDEPGICGCDKSEEDTDGDDTPDCIDQCKDDRKKIYPLKCGCGVSEDDNNGDHIPDCMDACPDDDEKKFPGVCGCDVPDTPQNTSDDDHDGVVNCLDTCPHNPTKSKEADGDCNEMDSDGDGVDDSMDKCPYNQNIATVLGKDEEQGDDEECMLYDKDNNVFHIYHPHNLVNLKKHLDNINSETLCTSTSPKTCITDPAKEVSAKECGTDLLWKYYSCTTCTPEEKDAEGTVTKAFNCADEKPIELKKALTIVLENNINLADDIPTSINPNNECYGKLEVDLNLTNVIFKGNHKTISYKQDTNTCSVNYAFFNKITLSEVSDLTLELNVSNLTSSSKSKAIFANEINSSVISNIHVQGKLTTAYTGTVASAIGGIAGRVYSGYSQYQRSKIVDSDAQNIEVTSTATAAASNDVNIGGYFGYVTDASVSLSGQHRIKSVKSNKIAGGFFGVLNITNKNDIINFENAEFEVDSVSGYGANGFAYTLTLPKSDDTFLTMKSFKATTIKSDNFNASGFVNSFNGNLKNVKSEIGSIVSSLSAAGFVYTSSGNTYTNIKNTVKEMKCESESAKDAVIECAGFIHSVTSNKFDHIDSNVEKITSSKDGSGFIYSVSTGFELNNSNVSVKELQAENAYGIYASYTEKGATNQLRIDGVHFSAERMTSNNLIVGLFGNVPASSAIFLNHLSAFANLDGSDLSKMHSVIGTIEVPDEKTPSTISLTNSFYAISNAVNGEVQESFTLLDSLTEDNVTSLYKNQIENNYFFVLSDKTRLTDLSVDPFASYVSLIQSAQLNTALEELQAEDSHWNTKIYSLGGSPFTLPAYVPGDISTP